MRNLSKPDPKLAEIARWICKGPRRLDEAEDRFGRDLYVAFTLGLITLTFFEDVAVPRPRRDRYLSLTAAGYDFFYPTEKNRKVQK